MNNLIDLRLKLFNKITSPTHYKSLENVIKDIDKSRSEGKLHIYYDKTEKYGYNYELTI